MDLERQGGVRIYQERKGKRRWEEEEFSGGGRHGGYSSKGSKHSGSQNGGSRGSSKGLTTYAKRGHNNHHHLGLHPKSLTSKSLSPITRRAGTTTSSPIFKGLSNMSARVRTTYGRRLLRHPTSWSTTTCTSTSSSNSSTTPRILSPEEQLVRTKIEKVVEAYANILDAVMEPEPDRQHEGAEGKGEGRVDKLAVMASRVVGRMLEQVVAEQVEATSVSQSRSRSASQSEAVGQGTETEAEEGEEGEEGSGRGRRETCAAEDEETRAALVDEWYDAVPAHHRRYVLPSSFPTLLYLHKRRTPTDVSFRGWGLGRHVLGQHALMLIIRTFPIDSTPSNPNHPLPSHLIQLYTSLNDLHLPFGPLIRPFSYLLIPSLLTLSLSRNPPSIQSLYEAYSEFYLQKRDFMGMVKERMEEVGWGEKGWKSKEVGTLVRLDPVELVVSAFEGFLSQRDELLVESRNVDQDDEAVEEDAVEGLEEDGLETLGSFLDALVGACVCKSEDETEDGQGQGSRAAAAAAAKAQLTRLSRLVFDAVTAIRPKISIMSSLFGGSALGSGVGGGRSPVLVELGIAIEAHRLALTLPFLDGSSSSSASDDAPVPTEAADDMSRRRTTRSESVFGPIHRPIRLQALLALAIPLDSQVLADSARRFLLAHQNTRLLAVSPTEARLTVLNEYLEMLVDPRFALRGFAKALVDVLLEDPVGTYHLDDRAGNTRAWLKGWSRRLAGGAEEEKEEEDEVSRDVNTSRRGSECSVVSEVVRLRTGDDDDDEVDEDEDDEEVVLVYQGAGSPEPASPSDSSSTGLDDRRDDDPDRPSKRRRLSTPPITSDATFVPGMLDSAVQSSPVETAWAEPSSPLPWTPSAPLLLARSSSPQEPTTSMPFALADSGLRGSHADSRSKRRSPEEEVASASPVASTSRNSLNDSGYGSRSPARMRSAVHLRTPSPDVQRKQPKQKTAPERPAPVVWESTVRLNAKKGKASPRKRNATARPKQSQRNRPVPLGYFKRSGSEDALESSASLAGKTKARRPPTPFSVGDLGLSLRAGAPPVPGMPAYYAAIILEDDEDELDLLSRP